MVLAVCLQLLAKEARNGAPPVCVVRDDVKFSISGHHKFWGVPLKWLG
jgi:hypothetical protein